MHNYDKLRLREKEISPTDEVLIKTLGKSFNSYQTFQKQVPNFELQQEWMYYNCAPKSWLAKGNYKWTTPRGTNKEKTIYWLSAWESYFCVTIWFKESDRWEILKAKLSESTKEMIRKAKLFSEKMATFPLVFEVKNLQLLADIYELIKAKIALC